MSVPYIEKRENVSLTDLDQQNFYEYITYSIYGYNFFIITCKYFVYLCIVLLLLLLAKNLCWFFCAWSMHIVLRHYIQILWFYIYVVMMEKGLMIAHAFGCYRIGCTVIVRNVIFTCKTQHIMIYFWCST